MEYFGKLQIDTTKIERSPQYLDHHGRTSTITDSITNYAQSYEAQATKDSKLKLFAFSTKSTYITARYTQTDRKNTKRSYTPKTLFTPLRVTTKTQLIRKLIDQASTNITLLWVPSHVEIPRNKVADTAKVALNEETQHTETYPLQDLIAWIKEKNEQEQQEKWKNSTTTMKERKPQPHNEHKH
jgi:hypothetical protein